MTALLQAFVTFDWLAAVARRLCRRGIRKIVAE